MSVPTNDPLHPDVPIQRGSLVYVARVLEVLGVLLALMFVGIAAVQGGLGTGGWAMVAIGVIMALVGFGMMKMR